MVRSRWTGLLAWTGWGVSVAAPVAALLAYPPTAQSARFLLTLVPALAFATVGGFVAARKPSNPIGWLFSGWGLAMTLATAADFYIDHGLARGSITSGMRWAGWVNATLWHPAFCLLVFILLLFPHGKLPSPRWRPFARFTIVVYLALAVSAALAPSAVQLYFPELTSPVPASGSALWDIAFGLLLPGQLALVAVGVVAQVVKLRRARGRERQQVTWFVYAVVVAVLTFTAGIVIFGAGVLFPVFAVIPIAAGMAILRQRLYDIDRVINRTVVWVALSVLLALAYVVAVVALSQIFGRSSELAVAGSTLVVAAVFGPARRRVQTVVDRRFNRRRYDAAGLVTAFSHRLRDEVDLDTITREMSGVVTAAMEPAGHTVWLRPAKVGISR